WLVGNIYSRVGTPDWVPDNYPSQDFERLVDETINNLCYWVGEPVKRKIAEEEKRRKRKYGETYELQEEEFHELLEKFSKEQESRKEELIARIVKVLEEIQPNLSGSDLVGKLPLRLKNDSEFSRLFR